MSKRNSLFPRPISPELILPGDTISVEYPEESGITVTKTGVVHAINPHGAMRHFVTRDNAVIGVYTPGFRAPTDFTLLMRKYEHETLSIFDDSDRIGA